MSDLSEISDDEPGTQVQNQRKEKGIKRSRELPNFDSEEDDDLQHDGLADSISSTDDIQPPPFRQSSSGNTRHLSVNQVLNQIDDEDNDDDHDDSTTTSMETAPYTCRSTPVSL
ncbi:uncharacterized protein LOC143055296 [Mytilus galloprovincialis]|uniref:uncharacterized protein LOC143055296 n=1 Tax=Mytilus galloprovincialis TaxID=29158 RepID=UPI003F7B4D3F